MPQDALSKEIESFEDKLRLMGCIGASFSPPNLRNSIHPMFDIDRWMRGYGQHTEEIYNRMLPAFRLASLFINEDCMIWWFAHIHFGDERTWDDGHGRRIRYIHGSPEQYSGLQEVRKTMSKLARSVRFHFVPDRYKNTDYGINYGCTADGDGVKEWPWYHHFKSTDFPPVPKGWRKNPHWWPHIYLSWRFRDFYLIRYSDASAGHRLRVHFIFAATLVHELNHAYYMFSGRDTHKDEPFASAIAPGGEPELGFEWEMTIPGRICNPLYNDLSLSHTLYGVETYKWHPSETHKRSDADIAISAFQSGEHQLTLLEVPVDESFLPASVLEGEWRAANYMGYDAYNTTENVRFIAHGLPMKWIASWFREEAWNRRRQYFASSPQSLPVGWQVLPPRLGPSFALVYERMVGVGTSMWIVSH